MPESKINKLKNLYKENALPWLISKKEKIAPKIKNKLEKAKPFVEKAKPVVKEKWLAVSPYIKKAVKKVYPFVKKRPLISGAAVLITLGILSNCGNNASRQTAQTSGGTGSKWERDFNKQENKKSRTSRLCEQALANPTHKVANPDGTAKLAIIGKTVVRTGYSIFTKKQVCTGQWILNKEYQETTDSGASNRWIFERQGENIVYFNRYTSLRKMIKNMKEDGDVTKTIYVKIKK